MQFATLLSLLIREYLSSTVNVLTKTLKTFHVTKSDIFNSITFAMINQDDRGPLIKIEPVFLPVSHVVCRSCLSNGSFQIFIPARVPGSVISVIRKLSGSSFFENVRNLMQIRKIQKKIEKKSFVFEINASELF